MFQVDRMKFSDVPQALSHLLLPADPLVFFYEICIDPMVPRKQQTYDIEIETVSFQFLIYIYIYIIGRKEKERVQYKMLSFCFLVEVCE